MVCLNRELLDEVANEIVSNLIDKRLRAPSCRELAYLVGAFCFTGREVLHSMTRMFSENLNGEIQSGDMTIKLEGGILMYEPSFLIPLLRVSIGHADVTLGEAETPEYFENLRLLCGAKTIRHATIHPEPIPAGGIKEFSAIFPQLETLQCPVSMIPADVNNAFPRLLNLTVDGSVPSILKFFENAGSLPDLYYLGVNLEGNVETFINKFVPSRTPRLQMFVMKSTHYGEGTFDKVDIIHRFANAFPNMVSVSVKVAQTSVVFNTDPAYYYDLYEKFTETDSKAVISLELHNTLVTELPDGHTLNHKQVLDVLKPLEYRMNCSGYYKKVDIPERTLTHFVFADFDAASG